MATMAALRGALAEYFDAAETRTVLLRLREAGTLPAGTCGRAGSAEITSRDAAIAVLALISGETPINSPAAAEAMAAYALAGFFLPLVGPASRHDIPPDAPPCTLLDFVSGEIEYAVDDPGARIVGYWIEGNRVSTLDPDRLAEFERQPGDPPVLRDVDQARERLVFQPAADCLRPTSDAEGRPYIAGLSFIVRPEMIRAVASAFRVQRRPATTLLTGGAA